jgi:general secretion pathway protein J
MSGHTGLSFRAERSGVAESTAALNDAPHGFRDCARNDPDRWKRHAQPARHASAWTEAGREAGREGFHAKRSTPNAQRQTGFTLIEVLIALSLLSLLMLVLTGAMASMGQTEERVEARIQAADDYRAAVDLLRDVLGRVSARRVRSLNADTPAEMPFFDAGPDALAWIGVMPARYGTGGRHYLRLGVEPGADGVGQLVLRFSPWTGEPTFANWGQAHAQVLAAPVTALTLGYQEPASGQWSPVWPPPGLPFNELPPSRLPSAVTLQIDGPAPAWPPLVAAVAPTRISDPSIRRGSSGAGRGMR